MQNSVISYPRIGALRELKFGIEKYFKALSSKDELFSLAKTLRRTHFQTQKEAGIDYISCNDFSFYDNILDSANIFGLVAKRYKDLKLDPLDEYFAQARGYQGEKGDVKALAMKKWFNTNYHYLVPECDDVSFIKLNAEKILNEYKEAKELGIEAKVVISGLFTFYKLLNFASEAIKKEALERLKSAYKELLSVLNKEGVKWLQFDEPYLVYDLDLSDISLFNDIYKDLLSSKASLKILIQTYFGDVRDIYDDLLKLDFDAIGLDFVEGKESLNLIKKGFDDKKILFAGLVNGKNIYKNNYEKSISLLKELKKYAKNIVINSSCSLLHSPYTIKNESKLDSSFLAHFAFAQEKLLELRDLKEIISSDDIQNNPAYKANLELF